MESLIPSESKGRVTIYWTEAANFVKGLDIIGPKFKNSLRVNYWEGDKNNRGTNNLEVWMDPGSNDAVVMMVQRSFNRDHGMDRKALVKALEKKYGKPSVHYTFKEKYGYGLKEKMAYVWYNGNKAILSKEEIETYEPKSTKPSAAACAKELHPQKHYRFDADRSVSGGYDLKPSLAGCELSIVIDMDSSINPDETRTTPTFLSQEQLLR